MSEQERPAFRWLFIAGLALWLLAFASCGLDIFLGALFFPIGPDGLSPRDAAIRSLSPWLWGGAGILLLAGTCLLLAASGLWLWRRATRRQSVDNDLR